MSNRFEIVQEPPLAEVVLVRFGPDETDRGLVGTIKQDRVVELAEKQGFVSSIMPSPERTAQQKAYIAEVVEPEIRERTGGVLVRALRTGDGKSLLWERVRKRNARRNPPTGGGPPGAA